MTLNKKLILLCALAPSLAGCTVIPDQVHANVPSFDGGAQNSGVIAPLPEGEWIVTAHWRDRFNALSAVYGASFIPHIVVDAGITPSTNGTFIATSQTVANFGKMNLLYKSQSR